MCYRSPVITERVTSPPVWKSLHPVLHKMRLRRPLNFILLIVFSLVVTIVLLDFPSQLVRKEHVDFSIREETASENSLINVPLKVTLTKDNTTEVTTLSERITSTTPQLTTLPKRPEIGKKTNYPLTIDSPYLINNPDICQEVKNLTFVIIVHTAPNHFERRRTIRETWANKNFYKKISVRIIFLLGKPKDSKLQFAIENENLIYRDLVQGNFRDSYQNLTHKGVLGFRWVSENCRHSKMVIKVDDDVYVNVFKLYTEIFPKYHNKSRYILCHVRNKNTSPIVRSKDPLKWKVKDDEFRGFRYYPTTYCNGYVVFISSDLIRAMYQASFSTPFFWVDDVYLYGLLPSKVPGVSYHNLVNIFTLDQGRGLRCFVSNSTCKYLVTNAWKTGVMKNLWLATLAKLKNESRQYISNQLFLSLEQMELQKALNEIHKQVVSASAKKPAPKKAAPPPKSKPKKPSPPKKPTPAPPKPALLRSKNSPAENSTVKAKVSKIQNDKVGVHH